MRRGGAFLLTGVEKLFLEGGAHESLFSGIGVLEALLFAADSAVLSTRGMGEVVLVAEPVVLERPRGGEAVSFPGAETEIAVLSTR